MREKQEGSSEKWIEKKQKALVAQAAKSKKK